MSRQTLRECVSFYLVDCTTLPGKAIDLALLGLNALTCVAYAAGTYITDADSRIAHAFDLIEWIFVAVFAIEYLLRIWVAEHRLRHIVNPYSIIDLMSILPVFSSVLDLRFLRVFRIFRIFRFLRFLQNEDFFFGSITQTQIRVARLAFTALAIVFVASGCIYEAEHRTNPSFTTLGDAAYYTVVTITTVGFGDMVPKTDAGKLVTVLMIIAGIIAIPYHIGQIARQVFLDTTGKTVSCLKCSHRRHDFDATYCSRCGTKLPKT